MAVNILVVDDSFVTRRIIKLTIGMMSLNVEKLLDVKNGADALVVLEETDIDLVFVDLGMPIMGGFEMIGRMKENEAMREIPIIIISAEFNKPKTEELLVDEKINYLAKPLTPERLKGAIMGVLEDCVHE